jgi:hypothetical protein
MRAIACGFAALSIAVPARATPVEVEVAGAAGTPGSESAPTIPLAIVATGILSYLEHPPPPPRTHGIAQLALGDDGDLLQVRRVQGEPDGEQVFLVLHKRGGSWIAWGDAVRIADPGCGMGGKCIVDTVETVDVARADDVAWLRLRVRQERTFGDRAVRRYDIVVGCKVSPALSCAQVVGGLGSTSIVRGRQVITRFDDEPRATVTTFDL